MTAVEVGWGSHSVSIPSRLSTTHSAQVDSARYIVFNYPSPEERLGLDFYRSLAEKLNAAARKADAAGLRFCYHNHDLNFSPSRVGDRSMCCSRIWTRS